LPSTFNAAILATAKARRLRSQGGLNAYIEFNTCEFLNDKPGFAEYGKWLRQDPGFPDTIFSGKVFPTPGFEVSVQPPPERGHLALNL
jgi:hypothetical protein